MIIQNVPTKNLKRKKAIDNKGLSAHLTYDVNEDIAAPYISKGVKPKVAVLREQGVNSHVKLAAALTVQVLRRLMFT